MPSSDDEGAIVVAIFESSSVLGTALCKAHTDVENWLTMGEYLCVHAEVLVIATAHVENRRFILVASRSEGMMMRE